jgi:methylamine utilization protein MauE
LALIVRTVLAVVLLAAAGLKSRALRESASALEVYRLPDWLRLPTSITLVLVEAAIAIGLLAGAAPAPYAAAMLFGGFAAVTGAALLNGKRGARCACFGPGSRVGLKGLVRDLTLAGAAASIPVLPDAMPSTVGWLGLGLGAAFACVVALAVAVLALAREVGMLHRRLPPDLALDIADEGPALGSRVEVPQPRSAPLTLAVFSSEGCRLCRTLKPVVDALAADPAIALAEFDELLDADVWQRLRVPGSPYAIAIDEDGQVRAKGTFNSYGQLEAIVAAAEGSLAGVAIA